MSPDSLWSNQFNKTDIKLSLKGIGWKNLMNECLVKTDIPKLSEEKCLDPNVLMDARHKMARNAIRVFPTPRERIQMEALRLLREETHNRLLKQKQGKMVEREIERLKQSLEKHRELSKKQLDEAAAERSKHGKALVPKFPERYTRLWRRFESYEVDTWVNPSVQMTMETNINDQAPPIEVRFSVKRRQEPEDTSAPVSCNRKGSVMSDGDGDGENEEREIMRQFSQETVKTPEFERDDHRRITNAWKTWRKFTLQRKKRKMERDLIENKIEAFFAKLQQGDTERVKKRSKSCIRPSNRSETISKERVKTAEEKKTEIVKKAEGKTQKLEGLMREVRASQEEVSQRLRTIGTQNERIKVLKTLAGVFQEVERKMPKFLLRMEARREDRMKRWKEIEERRRKIEEEKENARKSREEAEKLKAEEGKKKKLDELKEKRRVENEKKEEQKKEREKLRLADDHHRRLLLRSHGLRPWLEFISLRKEQYQEAVQFDERRSLQGAFGRWKAHATSRLEEKRAKAEAFCGKLLQRSCFLRWEAFREERVRQGQAAVDWNDLRLSERAFGKWLRFTQQEQLEYLSKKDRAAKNYEARLKKKYLGKWRQYPELRKLESAKEIRKKVWRQKIKEILPDYQPAIVSGDL